jgi:phage gp45-like
VIVSAIREGEIQRFDADGISKGEFLDREMFQQYGFSSGKSGMEGIVLGIGNVFYLIGSDDRRYRIAREDGETVIYTDEGDKIHLKRNRTIEIVGGTKVIVTSPELEVSGDLKVSGNIIGSGQVSDSAGTMAEMRSAYNSHTHPGGGAPNPQMT